MGKGRMLRDRPGWTEQHSTESQDTRAPVLSCPNLSTLVSLSAELARRSE